MRLFFNCLKIGFLLLSMIMFVSEVQAQPERFLVLSDIHLNPSSHHSMDFSPSQITLNNDLDRPTFEYLMNYLQHAIEKGTIQKPKFILFLGDIVTHVRQNKNTAVESETIVFKKLNHTFSDTPILYIFGNEDSLTADYGPFLSNDRQQFSPGYIARIKADWKGDFLSTGEICHSFNHQYPCILSQNINDGYYSANIAPNFRIIVLNTVMFSKLALVKDQQAIEKQFRWLEHQLQDAQLSRDSVILMMHILPGRDIFQNQSFWDKRTTTTFLTLIGHYQNTITSILASHTHYNEFKILKYPDLENHIVPTHVNGALSTAFGNAPYINIYKYEKIKNQWNLTEREVYSFEKNQKQEILLKKIFSFNQYYCHDKQQAIFECLKNITLQEAKRSFYEMNRTFIKKMKYLKNLKLDISGG